MLGATPQGFESLILRSHLTSADAGYHATGRSTGSSVRPERQTPFGRGRTNVPSARLKLPPVIFKSVCDGRPYPEHGFSQREWADVPPRQVRLDQLVTTKRVLDLDTLLSKDSTFYGDLFPHVVQWQGDLYLEDGLHRALRAALHQRLILHARVLELDEAR